MSKLLRRRRRRKATDYARNFLLAISFLSVTIIAAVVAVGLVNYNSYAREFVPPEAYGIDEMRGGARILDRNGELLYQFVGDETGIRVPVELDEISPAVIAATISTEDADFFVNPGVNTRGLVRAAWENFGPAGEDEILEGTGGSSITQQLVKNVYLTQEARVERDIDRKFLEIVYAIEMTKRYDKNQILEWYLNNINYGGLYNGIEAASRGYFGKPAAELTLAEAALLAGIPQSPAQYDPRVNTEAAIERRNQVLDILERRGRVQIGPETFYEVDPAEIAEARQAPVETLPSVHELRAPHFVLEYVGPQLEALVGRDAMLQDGLIVTTTLDIGLQDRAREILDRSIALFEEISNTHNGAAVVIEPGTGEILVMIGSRDYYREDIDGAVNNLLAPNSPGSSFKPFVYLLGMQTKGWTDQTRLQDTPITFVESNGQTFSPTNPIKGYQGSITLRNALGNSLNVPPFKAAMEIGVDNIVEFARMLGFTSLDGRYGPSIAIGGVDLRPLELAYGYAMLANGGVVVGHEAIAPEQPEDSPLQPFAIKRIETAEGEVLFDADEQRVKRRVVEARNAHMISDILSDPRAQCLTFGCGGLSIPGYQVAVKTGTSEPYDPAGPDRGKIGETWAFGYTPDYVVGIWAGNADNSPITNIYSTSISYRAMRDILLATYNGRPGTPFPKP